MKRPYVYRVWFADIRDRLNHALKNYGFTFGQALGYTQVECSLLEGDAIRRALKHTALAKVAFEFDYLKRFEAELGQSDPLSAIIREQCPDDLVDAAAALETEEDRSAFSRDIKDVRTALKISA